MTTEKLVKYLKISSEIAQQIQAGVLKPGDQLPSTRELALYHNASVLTIRQAVAHLAKSGLVRSSQGKGTFVADAIQSKIQEMPSIRLIIGTGHEAFEHDRFNDLLLHHICVHASESGMSTNVSILDRHQSINDFLRRENTSNLKNGIILLTAGEELSSSSLHLLRENRIPYVVIPYERRDGIPQVRADGEQGWLRCFRELQLLGHQHILILSGYNSLPDVAKVTDELGIPITPSNLLTIIPGEESSGYAAIQRALEQKVEFTAVVCSGDNATLGAVKALFAANKNIPRDISVISYDRYAWIDSVLPVKITGCQQDLRSISRAVLDFIIEQKTAGIEIVRDIQIPMEFITGNSCAMHPDGIRRLLDQARSQ